VSETVNTRTAPVDCDVLIKGTVITVDPERHVFIDGYVAIKDGKIAGVGRAADCSYRASGETVSGNLLVLPGLVNLHGHLVQGVIRGMAEGAGEERGTRFMAFQFPMTDTLDEEESYVSALPGMAELLRSGVTTSEDTHFTNRNKRSVDGVIRAAKDAGLRLREARLIVNDPETTMETMREDVDEGLAEVDRVRSEWQSETIDITTGTIGIAYLRMEDMKPIHDWTRAHGAQFDIHAPSGGDQMHLAKRGWPGGSFEWLEDRGMLGPDLLAGNAQSHVRPGEHDLVAKRGAKICVVPDTLFLLGASQFEVKAWTDRGVDVGIGLDGSVIAYHQNLWMAMHAINGIQRVHDSAERGSDMMMIMHDPDFRHYGSAEKALEMATIGGARALGYGDRVGSLEPGKEADVLVMDMTEALHLSPKGSLVQELVYSGAANTELVKHVYVAGRKVVDNGRTVNVDVPKAIERLDKLQDDVFERLGITRYKRGETSWKWVD
jgi:5-methylthioadenosine/S-adenosylhomocysteine deaminase